VPASALRRGQITGLEFSLTRQTSELVKVSSSCHDACVSVVPPERSSLQTVPRRVDLDVAASRNAKGALLDAARRLAGQQPARPFGVREVARAAGVNHSLVYRYYGSLEGLLDEATADRDAMTLRLLDDRGTDAIVTALFDLVLEQPFVTTRLAEVSLGANAEGWTQQTVLVRKIRDRVGELHEEMEPDAVSALTASLVAAAFGYVLYEKFLAASLRWPPERLGELRGAHRMLLDDLLHRPAASPSRNGGDELQ
jgi:AcrR family transcriptional regulator